MGLVRLSWRFLRAVVNRLASRALGQNVQLVLMPVAAAPALPSEGVTLSAEPEPEPAPTPTEPLPVVALPDPDQQCDDLPLDWLACAEPEGERQTLLQSKTYSIATDTTGALLIQSAEGSDLIIRGMSVVAEWVHGGARHRQQVPLRCNGHVAFSEDGRYQVVATASTPSFVVSALLSGSPTASDVQIKVRSLFVAPPAEMELIRLAAIMDFAGEVAELYLKNRKTDNRVSPWVWLDRQGAAFGHGKNAAVVYHTPRLSSLQIAPEQNRLVLNLDLSDDHPQLLDNPTGRFLNASRVRITEGVALNGEFSILLGARPASMPRLLAQPDGYVATHIWTEHGCYTDARTHAAVYYGSDQIQSAEKATGGFVKHNIPTTKSIFYDNPTNELNDSQSETFKGNMVSLKQNPAFEKIMLDLHKHNFEICLHCSQPVSATPEALAEAMQYMHENFDSKTWIDHFWYRPDGFKSGCRESFCNCGLTDKVPNQYWEKYGVSYFWNPVYEYLKVPHKRSDREYLNHWVHDNSLPNPVYWRHPTAGVPLVNNVRPWENPFVSWPTWEAWFPREGLVRYTQEQLHTLVDDWGVAVAHAYPTYVGESNTGWQQAEDGSIVISQELDDLLAHMEKLQKDGLLYNGTIRSTLSYWIALEAVSWSYDADGEIFTLHNSGSTPLTGVGLAWKTDVNHLPTCDESPVTGKWVGDDFIFCVDLPANSSVRLSGISKSAHP